MEGALSKTAIIIIIGILIISIASFMAWGNQSNKSEITKRDYIRFPQDENGDILYGFYLKGIKLDMISKVDFAVIFPNEKNAIQFDNVCKSLGLSTNLSNYDSVPGYTFQVIASKSMIPSHANISEWETKLGEIAKKFGGRNDGWGFMTKKQ